MGCKMIPVLSILVLLLSLSLLLPLSSTTNTHLIGKKMKQEIRRNLIGVRSGRGGHPGGGAPGHDRGRAAADNSGKENLTPATQTQGHN
ncbi:hypothetical protein PVK06_034872 [Gossypium arboreum]|uniref:Uncharacterized protein n=1 Tax=Gossypium arboreum TaxID=29729 RepID=A0ABR0NFE8_GOSAR|nr:hypothetical protein PVK06_034872 [Gossypium arboreum]